MSFSFRKCGLGLLLAGAVSCDSTAETQAPAPASTPEEKTKEPTPTPSPVVPRNAIPSDLIAEKELLQHISPTTPTSVLVLRWDSPDFTTTLGTIRNTLSEQPNLLSASHTLNLEQLELQCDILRTLLNQLDLHPNFVVQVKIPPYGNSWLFWSASKDSSATAKRPDASDDFWNRALSKWSLQPKETLDFTLAEAAEGSDFPFDIVRSSENGLIALSPHKTGKYTSNWLDDSASSDLFDPTDLESKVTQNPIWGFVRFPRSKDFQTLSASPSRLEIDARVSSNDRNPS